MGWSDFNENYEEKNRDSKFEFGIEEFDDSDFFGDDIEQVFPTREKLIEFQKFVEQRVRELEEKKRDLPKGLHIGTIWRSNRVSVVVLDESGDVKEHIADVYPVDYNRDAFDDYSRGPNGDIEYDDPRRPQ